MAVAVRFVAGARLDRVAWIVGLALVAACVAPTGDEVGSGASALADRWTLPADVRAVGADVHLHYDAAPRWASPPPCTGGLTKGARALGTFLRDKFTAVSSVGGYACRKNTADGSRVSVHGTGRALDVFIPTNGGKADRASGDPVANWLVLHAEAIGVQLVIWDRSIWRANGTNEGRYGGPVPHVDHIHVELTLAASRKETAWFVDGGDVDAGDPADEDGGVGPSDDDGDMDDAGAIDEGDAGMPDEGDAEAGFDAGAPSDPSGGASGDPSDPSEPSAPAADASAGSTDDGDPLPDHGTPDSAWEQDEDEAPTPRDALGTKPKTTRTSHASRADDVVASRGCSAAPGSAPSTSAALLAACALALAGAGRRRRRGA